MRNDNIYAQILANHVSDCISGRNNLTTLKSWDDISDATAKTLGVDLSGVDSSKTVVNAIAKVLNNSTYGMVSMPTDTVFLKKVIYNDPATIAFWSDGTKTVVKAQPGDIFDSEKGLAMAIVKKACGNTGNYYNSFKRWLPKEPVGNEEIIYEPEKHEDTIEEDEYYE